MREKTPLDPVSGPLLSSIFRFTVPLVLMNLLQIMFNASDTVIVGRFAGGMSVAAVGGTGSLIFSIVGVFSGLSVGAGVSAAQAIGARDEQRTVRTVHTAMLTAFIGGLIITSIGFFGCRFFLGIMNTPEKIIGLATTYMRIYFLGSVPNMIYVFGAAILRAAGDTKRPLYFRTFSGALNLVLNVIMVAVLKLNVVGVALATVISQTVSAVLVLVSLIKRKDNCRFVNSNEGVGNLCTLFVNYYGCFISF